MWGFKKTSLALVFSIVTSLSASSAFAAPPPFAQWLNDFKKDAISQGIDPTLVNRALTGIQPDPKVIKLDMPKNQPELSESFASYSSKRVSAARIQKGQDMLRKHGVLLDRIGKKYGVKPQYIVALWGMETNYGGYTGNDDVIRSLVTLAWNGRDGTSPNRAKFFRKELITALRIIQEGNYKLGDLKGSWAGAFGQVQFMPSSFMRLAADGDGDGHRDITHNLADAFASAANYLAKSGWHNDERWGRQVRLPAGFSSSLIGSNQTKSLAEWKALGVKQMNGAPIPVVAGMRGSIVAPDGPSGPVYLVYNNFHTIKKWNNSDKFALSVGLLANAIAPAAP